jgi:hypothetical protein
MSMTMPRCLSLAIILAGTGAHARPTLGDTWPVADIDREAGCALELRNNPIAIRMDASGLVPGERFRIVIRNGAMKPLEAAFTASADGTFREYYAPLRKTYAGQRRLGAPLTSGEESGRAEIEIDARSCTLNASAPWSRNIRVIP